MEGLLNKSTERGSNTHHSSLKHHQSRCQQKPRDSHHRQNQNGSGNLLTSLSQNKTDRSSSSSRKSTSTTTTSATRKMSSKNVILLVLVLTLMLNDTAFAISCNSECQNGGYMLISGIFGYCRCVCNGDYVGDACQYPTRKRKVRVLKLQDVLRNLIQKMYTNNDDNND